MGIELSNKEVELQENSLSIGAENGDILFIDKREIDSPLYIFYHDGADIEKTKFKLSDIYKGNASDVLLQE